MRPSAPPGSTVKLTVDHGATPEIGAELRTPSGRRYLVAKVGGRKTLHCVVLSPNSPPGDPIVEWTWTARNKRREP